MKHIFPSFFFLLSFFLTACGPQDDPKVVATVGMLGDIAATVADDCAEVQTMMGPGVDPHLYKASAGDVQLLQNASLIFYSGYNLEGQMGEILERLAETRPVTAVAEAAIDESDTLSYDENAVDPHLWMDVALWANSVDVITENLTELNPECAADMRERADSLKTELAALNEWILESVASIPAEQRVLVTAHDAFEYYGRAYDIEVEGIQGISTASEASLADIRETVDLVVERAVPALFVESSINPRTIEAVQAAVADRGSQVGIGEPLYSDAMGEAGTADGTYIGMLRRNTLHIVDGLGGEVAAFPEALSGWVEAWEE